MEKETIKRIKPIKRTQAPDFLSPLVVHRCDNEMCRRVLPPLENTVSYQVSGKTKYFFCDEWCKQERIKPIIRKGGQCIYCENATQPIITNKDYLIKLKSGKTYIKPKGRIVNWHKVCEECNQKKHAKALENAEKRKLIKQKVVDLVGHTCTKCKIYKTFDYFYKVKNQKTPSVCKECKNKAQKEWVKNNKERYLLNHKIYYHTKIKLKNKAKKETLKTLDK